MFLLLFLLLRFRRWQHHLDQTNKPTKKQTNQQTKQPTMAKRRSDVGHLSKEEYEALERRGGGDDDDEGGGGGGGNRRASAQTIAGRRIVKINRSKWGKKSGDGNAGATAMRAPSAASIAAPSTSASGGSSSSNPFATASLRAPSGGSGLSLGGLGGSGSGRGSSNPFAKVSFSAPAIKTPTNAGTGTGMNAFATSTKKPKASSNSFSFDSPSPVEVAVSTPTSTISPSASAEQRPWDSSKQKDVRDLNLLAMAEKERVMNPTSDWSGWMKKYLDPQGKLYGKDDEDGVDDAGNAEGDDDVDDEDIIPEHEDSEDEGDDANADANANANADASNNTAVAVAVVLPMKIQRQKWEQLKKAINGTINRLNGKTIKDLIHSLFQNANLIRGKGLMAKSILRAATTSPTYCPVYASLISVVNTKLPEVGELIVTRAILMFRKSYARQDRAITMATANFMGCLFNQGLCHELLCLQILTVLLEGEPTDDSVEVAVQFTKVVGMALNESSPTGIHAIMERFRNLLHDGRIGRRVQYKIEEMMKIRKNRFKEFPALEEDLDLVESEEQITFELGLDDEGLEKEEHLDVFRFDPNWSENENDWIEIRREIIGDDNSDASDDSGTGTEEESEEEDDDSDSDDEDDEDGVLVALPEEPSAYSANDKQITEIRDMSETDLINLRRTIYLTIMSSATFEECSHKLSKMDIPIGKEMELINMLIECCSQERTFLRYYGLIAARFCLLHRRWSGAFHEAFIVQYNTIHRLETNKLRNVSKLFSHLLHTDSLSWSCLSAIHLNEDETTSSSRIFLKILIQEMAEAIGIGTLVKRFESDDPETIEWFKEIFPRDNPRKTRYAINFFTSIGLGPLTDGLREYLKNAPKIIMQQAREEAARLKALENENGSDSDTSSVVSSSSSSVSSSSGSSSSYTSSSSGSYASSSTYTSSDESSYSKRRKGRSRSRKSRSKGGSGSGSGSVANDDGDAFRNALAGAGAGAGAGQKKKPVGVTKLGETTVPVGATPVATPAPTLYVNVMDTISGQILHRVSHHHATSESMPSSTSSTTVVPVSISENWIVYAFPNLKSRRTELGVLTLYEGMIDKHGITAFSSPEQQLTFSSLSGSSSKPIVLNKTYGVNYPVSAMGVTNTKNGISSKNFILATGMDGKVVKIDRRLLDPRRPSGEPKKTEKMEGLMQYGPLIPLTPVSIESYSHHVQDASLIISTSANLESQTLVMALGGPDIFFSRFAPSKGFDSLPESFNKLLIVMVLIGLSMVLRTTKRIGENRSVKLFWS
mmetsp:Transcript_8557/g.12205  ORF Transcript_8557/g.12205 Transcript_8557/m.12205 type:complete len:1279 (+) Transcript_8557:142-3978(+)